MVNSRINYLVIGVYATLKYYMNATTKSCYPSYKTLSDKTGLSTPTLKKYIDLLEDEGYLKRINRGFKNSNLYTFNIRDIYIEDSEMFSFDFLNNEKLDFKSKSAYIVLQEYMSNKYLYTFDLETIGQAVLFNRKKIEEHDEILHEMQEEIKRLNHEVKLLQKQSNAKNREEIKPSYKFELT